MLYLIPCPGPQAIFFTRILEELLTIDIQSSPGKSYIQIVTLLINNNRISNRLNLNHAYE